MLRRWIEKAAARLATMAVARGLIHVGDITVCSAGLSIEYQLILPGPALDDEPAEQTSLNGYSFTFN